MASDTSVADTLETLAAKLVHQAKGLRDGNSATPQQHEDLVDTLKRVQDAVYLPRDDLAAMQMGFVTAAAIRLLVHWKVLEKIPDTGSIPYEELATQVGGDVGIITRVCWLLVAAGLLVQKGTDRVAHTARTRLFAGVNPLRALWLMAYDEYVPVLLAMPRYYDVYGIKEPTGRLHTIKAFTEGSPDLTVGEIMSRHPERTANMMISMSAMASQYPHTGFYDFGWVVPKAAEDATRPLIVDIGGAKGWTLQAICQETPGIPISRCVLQDLPGVIQMVQTVGDEDIRSAQLMAIDFHKEQPVKGALVYMIRRVLRDFGDDECVSILQHVVAAMAPDSKLLIADTVTGNPPSWFPAMVDFLLSAIGGKERIEEDFRKITERAGLKITGVHYSDKAEFAMIECEKT
ncbi:S-adenosyl-L-methionine-dependent methyltransferase [Aspergillus sclerotioniger CBS 115572]|uniref:S-adenosyl-L-methionine-dependent methyltransferase n=1 Tax=Aspergillus sclerotioniger CBS 115572 TaxID=1450535 RepID=A0A317X844_9EURO|nr:S-adenosyl-L-methionine-dependent methyltransferase [Aspergillus sclerotioniger CBS 115572]PWY94776.1 S-adenosyl-L-methionine-dependent methyltransferase [Aspergillus sclerotioniger CBS 115572]